MALQYIDKNNPAHYVIPEDDPNFPILRLTFGLELEFDWVYPRDRHRQWAINHPEKSAAFVYDEDIAEHGSVSSFVSDNIVQRVERLQYLLAYLNHQVYETAQRTSVIIPPIIYGEDPKTASAEFWHLTFDNSVTPTRDSYAEHARKLLEKFKATSGDVRAGLGPVIMSYESEIPHLHKTRGVVGAEFVSAVLNFQDQNRWAAQVSQIDQDLKPWRPAQVHAAYFDKQNPAFHVHFAIYGKTYELKTAQNLMALYALYQREIESWLELHSRSDTQWSKSLRLGMEINPGSTDRQQESHNLETLHETDVGPRYTPEEFLEELYKTESIEDLKTFVSGYKILIQEGEEVNGGLRDWVAVNLSAERGNKPATIEFRQHHGTVDREQIAWWVMFCGRLLRYSHFLAELGIPLAGGFRDTNAEAWVAELAETHSILELLDFPAEGREFFKGRADEVRSEWWDLKTHTDDLVIKERSKRIRKAKTKAEAKTGQKMDDAIMKTKWYRDMSKELRETFPEEERKVGERMAALKDNWESWMGMGFRHHPYIEGGPEPYVENYDSSEIEEDDEDEDDGMDKDYDDRMDED